jgi:hypothetical protein
MKKYYVYAHYRASGNFTVPFYIGKGCGKRINSRRRSDYWTRIVSLYGFTPKILFDSLSEKDAYSLEVKAIAECKAMGGCECNFTLGGDGVRVKKRWWNQKISDAMSGRYSPSGRESRSYKDSITKEQLYDMYINKNMSSVQIAESVGLSYTTICARIREFGLKPRSPSRRPLSVYCENNGVVYNSISDAARSLGVYKENIRKVLSGKYSQTGGYIFKYHTT